LLGLGVFLAGVVGGGGGVDTLEPHSHSLNLCYISYSSDHTLSQLTWLLLMHCYYIRTPFVIEIALCVETKSCSLGMQWYEMP